MINIMGKCKKGFEIIRKMKKTPPRLERSHPSRNANALTTRHRPYGTESGLKNHYFCLISIEYKQTGWSISSYNANGRQDGRWNDAEAKQMALCAR